MSLSAISETSELLSRDIEAFSDTPSQSLPLVHDAALVLLLSEPHFQMNRAIDYLLDETELKEKLDVAVSKPLQLDVTRKETLIKSTSLSDDPLPDEPMWSQSDESLTQLVADTLADNLRWTLPQGING